MTEGSIPNPSFAASAYTGCRTRPLSGQSSPLPDGRIRPFVWKGIDLGSLPLFQAFRQIPGVAKKSVFNVFSRTTVAVTQQFFSRMTANGIPKLENDPLQNVVVGLTIAPGMPPNVLDNPNL